MAGRGPVPKDSWQRARRNAEPVPLRVIPAEPVEQPPLPDTRPQGKPWPEQTRRWWTMWAASPLSDDFGATDWSFLRDTALLHAALWDGDIRVAGELRLRVASFGATPADRARLRISFAAADQAKDRRPRPVSASRRSAPFTG